MGKDGKYLIIWDKNWVKVLIPKIVTEKVAQLKPQIMTQKNFLGKHCSNWAKVTKPQNLRRKYEVTWVLSIFAQCSTQ